VLLIAIIEDGNQIDLAIFESFVVWLLGVSLAELSLESFVWLEDFGDWGVWKRDEIGDELLD
jgi:hypothetical protein